MSSRLGFALLVMIIGQHCSKSVELPAPPAGYHWQHASEIHTSLLVPNGWHVRSASDDKSTSYYIARKPFGSPSHSQTGLTFVVMPHLRDRIAAKYAMEFIAAACANRSLMNARSGTKGAFIGNGCFAEDEGTTLYTLMIANVKTNTLYQFIYSAPTQDWRSSWPTGQTMIRSTVLDDGF